MIRFILKTGRAHDTWSERVEVRRLFWLITHMRLVTPESIWPSDSTTVCIKTSSSRFEKHASRVSGPEMNVAMISISSSSVCS